MRPTKRVLEYSSEHRAPLDRRALGTAVGLGVFTAVTMSLTSAIWVFGVPVFGNVLRGSGAPAVTSTVFVMNLAATLRGRPVYLIASILLISTAVGLLYYQLSLLNREASSRLVRIFVRLVLLLLFFLPLLACAFFAVVLPYMQLLHTLTGVK